mgnify:FL=1
MRRWGYHLSAAAAVLALAACSPSEETNMTDTEESGVTDTADLPGAQLNVAIQAETESLEWLEDVEGERALAFATEMNEQSLDRLTSDPRYDTLYNQALEVLQSTDRIPYVGVRNGELWNFWQDADHVKGLWRKTSVESYATDNPEWDVVLDLDALGEAEGHNWVWRGADCLAPDYTRCMITLSDGGSDAAVRREFNMETREFIEDGFVIDETKGSTAWIDADTLLIATALDPAEATQSGYPFVVKRWSRGTPIEEAQVVISGAEDNVGVWPARFEQADGTAYMMAIQAASFFESVYYYLPDGATGEPVQMPLPRKSSPQTLFDGQLVFSIEEDWTPVEGGETYPTGSILSFDMGEFVETGELPAVEVVFTPNERQSIDGVATTANHLLMVINDNVVGGLEAFTRSDSGWTSESVETPENASISIVTADDHSDLAYVNVEGFLEPEALYRLSADLQLDPAKAAPSWFDAEGLVVEQRQAEGTDGTMIPDFIVRPEDAGSPHPILA